MQVRIAYGAITIALALAWLASGQPPERRGDGPGGRPGPPATPVMTTLDANGDGMLSAEEIAGASAALRKLDKDGDGKLSGEEMRPRTGFGDWRARIGRPGPKSGPGSGPAAESAPFPSEPQAKDDAERKALTMMQEISKAQGWQANVPVADGRMLRLLTEALGAKKVVEIGTSNGISSIWFALALRKTGGRLITHEIDPETAALAKTNLAKAGVEDLVTIVVGDAHRTITQVEGPIDVVFIDADKHGYLDYLKKTLPLVRPGGVVLAHNMIPSMADPDFVKAIITDPDLETVFYTAGGGLSVSLKKR